MKDGAAPAAGAGSPADEGVCVRDPLWDTIRVDPVAMRIVDAPDFQRLRHIKQLGHAHLVYPGATHTRFDHALGVYHLARRALALLGDRRLTDGIDPTDRALLPLAALLHDIGHYPFSHALEELETGRIPGHHEALAGRFLTRAEVSSALRSVADDGPARVEALIRGRSENPLQGLVSGSLDLDKIDYLRRDARFCGVPYGEVDVDRLLHGLTVVRGPDDGRLEIGVHEKGVAALESLLFAKYQMFRNVYWHHAVRAATVMYKRVVAESLEVGLIAAAELVGETDEGLLYLIASRSRESEEAVGWRVGQWIEELRQRRLPKRAAEVVAADLDGMGVGAWVETDTVIRRRVEDQLARELGLEAGDVFLDYPEKTAMFGLDLLVQRRDGDVIRLGPGGRAGLIGLPRIADELYRTARVLRLFTRRERRTVSPAALASLVGRDDAKIAEMLERGSGLLR